MRIGIVVMAAVLGLMPATAWAKDKRKVVRTSPTSKAWLTLEKRKPHSPWTRASGWGNQARGKFLFGSKNALLGWTELLTEPYQAAKQDRSVALGLGRGLVNGVVDTVGGAVHLVTFPITTLDLPLPQSGV